MDLDELLTAATPAATPRTPRLHEELAALVAATEAAQRPHRRRVRIAVMGGVVAGVLGLGTVASATGILPGWAMLTTSSGQTCEVEVRANLLRSGDGEPISATFTPAEQEQTLAAAEAFLTNLDYNSIDHQKAITEWQVIESKIRAEEMDPSERQPKLEGDDLEVHAVTHTVVERMRSDLAAQGQDLRAISITVSSSGCDL